MELFHPAKEQKERTERENESQKTQKKEKKRKMITDLRVSVAFTELGKFDLLVATEQKEVVGLFTGTFVDPLGPLDLKGL